ncbi:hypothetical protein VNO77_04838 [Canavalia gladiata]|uniref:Uncharacterized protein n=1 Tax=Canavalia gladiata TaxID=3824 RepID=A0AAN9R848_CANGL
MSKLLVDVIMAKDVNAPCGNEPPLQIIMLVAYVTFPLGPNLFSPRSTIDGVCKGIERLCNRWGDFGSVTKSSYSKS